MESATPTMAGHVRYFMEKLAAAVRARGHSAECHIDNGKVEPFGNTAWSVFYELVDGEDGPDRPLFARTCR